ncbi:MAG: DUF2892 domain-containing protein [Candidatus Woesearchaeota archaeon]
MKCNEGKVDRTIRIIIGLVILVSGYYYKSLLGLIGLLPLLTGLIGFCPAYLLFKINTNKK